MYTALPIDNMIYLESNFKPPTHPPPQTPSPAEYLLIKGFPLAKSFSISNLKCKVYQRCCKLLQTSFKFHWPQPPLCSAPNTVQTQNTRAHDRRHASFCQIVYTMSRVIQHNDDALLLTPSTAARCFR